MAEKRGVVKQRDNWFDNAKGILMILVVVGHLLASAANKFEIFAVLLNLIYFFHMPAFAIISGFFLKRRVDTRDYASVINKNFLPYCFAQLIIYIAALVLPSGAAALSAEHLVDTGIFSFMFPIYHLWYFFGVIFAFLFCIGVNAKEHPVRALLVSVIISLFCGVVPAVAFLKLTKTLAFLPFFVLGYIMPKDTMQRFKEKKLIIPSVLIIAAVTVTFFALGEKGILTGIFSMTRRYERFGFGIPYWAAILVRLGFIVGSVIFSFAFLNICPKKKSIFTIIGERSVYVYILHVLIIAVIRHFNYEYGVLRVLRIPGLKFVYILLGVAICYLLVSKPVVKVFKRFFEPDFDIRKIPEYLKVKKDGE